MNTRQEDGREEDDGNKVIDTRDCLSELPHEVFTTILLNLANTSIKSTVRCRCVCKSWRDFILNLNFTRLHSMISSNTNCVLLYSTPKFCHPIVPLSGLLQFQNRESRSSATHPSFNLTEFSFDFPEYNTRFSSSCNGLICSSWIINRSKTRLFVSNPLTREFVFLPLLRSSAIVSSIYGFGFNHNTNQYKVINIFTNIEHIAAQNIWRANVHTLGTGKWRNIGIVPYIFSSQPNTYLNGNLYWVVAAAAAPMSRSNYSICSFNLETEQFKSLALLPQVCQSPRHRSTVGVFRDRVCIVCDLGSIGFRLNAEIWVLKENIHDHHKTKELLWTKELVFKVTISVKEVGHNYYTAGLCYLTLVKVLENGAILFKYGPRFLILYDHREGNSRCLRVHVDDVVAHVPSFVSLKNVASGNKWNVINARYKRYWPVKEKPKQELQWEPT